MDHGRGPWLWLWWILSLALSLSLAGAHKCCPPGQALTPALACAAPAASRRLLYDAAPRPLLANCSIVSATQDVRVHCIDLLVDDTRSMSVLVGVVCDGAAGVEVPDVHYVRKCCPPHRRYSDFRRGCRDTTAGDDPVHILRTLFLNDTRAAVDLQWGAPRCPAGWVLYDLFLHHRHVWRQESESILLKHQPGDVLLVPEQFCVDLVTTDELSLVVRACQDSAVLCDLQQKPCLSKCCRDGQSFKNRRCVDSGAEFDVTFYSLRPGQPPTPTPVSSVGLAFEDQSPFFCEKGKYVLDPMSYPDDLFFLTDTGSLALPRHPFNKSLVGWRDFCLELLDDRVLPLMCFPSLSTARADQEFLHFRVIAVGLVVSGVFLLVTFLVYTCLPSLHNLHGQTLLCHVGAMLAAYACLVTSQLLSGVLKPASCAAIGYGIQFFFLAAFSWLNVICFDIWWTFGAIRSHVGPGKAEESRRRLVQYSLYAWLVPLTITLGTYLVDTHRLVSDNFLPNMAHRWCWFHRETHGKTIFFNLPVMIQITTNIVYFALTIRNCSKIKSELRQMQNNSNAKLRYHADINKLVMDVKLFIVMGLTWGCEVVTWYLQAGDDSYWWYLLDAANIFQGIAIFFIFVIKKKVIRALKLRIHEVTPFCASAHPKHRPSSSTIFTTVASSEGRSVSQTKK